MIITLYLGNEIVESRFIPQKNLSIDGYLEGLKNDMMEQNEEIMDLSHEKPVIVVENLPAKKLFQN